MLVGASSEPTRLPVTHGFIFRSPAFELERIPPLSGRSIGSGSRLPELGAEVERIASEDGREELAPFSTMHWPGGVAFPLMLSLGDAATRAGTPTVSENLVACVVRPDGFEWMANDTQAMPSGAPLRMMPPIARTYAEFEALAGQYGFVAAAAIA
jgi:hypothetical protein